LKLLGALKINVESRFSDFDAIANDIKIFQNPFNADMETLAPELQIEMIDLQCSDIFEEKYLKSSLLEFYKSLTHSLISCINLLVAFFPLSALLICVKKHSPK
jgi:hypothetical protein